jgi:excisionase family DNA binding protein
MDDEPVTSELTLQEVADELGVHYMTAYRYVRIGMLPARKVGRSWVVLRDDLEALRRDEVGPADRGEAPWAERLTRRLIAGDEAGAWKVIEASLAAGHSAERTLAEVVSPAMKTVGDMWESGAIGVDQEHTASAICLRLLGRLGARFARRGISKGTVVLGTTAEELHGLPTAIVAEVVRQAGFEVIDLGPLVPPEAFANTAAHADELVAVGVSATLRDQDDALRDTVGALRARIEVPVYVGGAAVTSADHAESLGADGWARSATELVEMLLAG